MAADWRDLAGRAAEPNPFMEPALVAAAAACGAPIRVLLAWRFGDEARASLAGAWALRIGHPPSRFPVRVLTALNNHVFLGTPVIDRNHLDDVIEGMLEAIARAPDLPGTIVMRQVAQDGPTISALKERLNRRGSHLQVVESWNRPVLAATIPAEDHLKLAMSASSRKKLRQHWRGLEKHGRLEFLRHTAAPDVEAAFEQFLMLEAAGWKGRAGTALVCNANDSRFARTFITALAAEGTAWIVALHLDGRPIAIQVMLRSGSVAFTWKTAYDETYSAFSPGILLLQELTRRLLADPAFASANSCSHEEVGFMGDLWRERQAIADICFDVRPGKPLSLRLVGTAEALFFRARLLRRRLMREINARRRKRAAG